MRSIRVVSITFAVGLVVACGGATSSNLLGPGDGGGNSSGGSNSSGGHSSSSSSSSGGHGSSSSSSGVGSSSGSGSSSGGMMDGGSDDGPQMIDSGGDPGILCGAKHCNAQSQQCCITGMEPNQTHQCLGQGDSCTGTPMTCDNTAECPMSMVCCGQINQFQTAYQQVACAADCSNQQGGQRQFCDPMANDCPMGLQCGASMLLPGYMVCQ